MKKIVKPFITIAIMLLIIGVVLTLNVHEKVIDELDLGKKENIIEDSIVNELMEKIEFSFGSKYYELYYEKDLKAEKLPNAAKLSLAGSAYRRKNAKSHQMTKEEMKEELINIFGSEVEYKDEEFNAGVCFAESMKIEDDNYIFTGGCNGLNLNKTYFTKVVKAEKSNKYIEITQKVAYVLPKEIDVTTMNSALNVYNKKNGKLLGSVEMDETFNIDNYLDELKSYMFRFKKENDNYYFESVKEIK